jgi:hypothetical protein
MTNALTIHADNSAVLGALPSFVRLNPCGSASTFDYWAAQPIGNDATDYARGAQYFRAALDFAALLGSINFLSFILGAIVAGNVRGSIESGFIDALCGKAAVGAVPVLDAEALALPDMVAAANYAELILSLRDAELIRLDIEEIADKPRALFSGAVLHMYCRAALLGARH